MVRNRYDGQYITEIYGIFSQIGMGYWLLRTYGLWGQIPRPPSWWIKKVMGFQGLWVI